MRGQKQKGWDGEERKEHKLEGGGKRKGGDGKKDKKGVETKKERDRKGKKKMTKEREKQTWCRNENES